MTGRLRLPWLVALAAAVLAPVQVGLSAAPGIALAREADNPEPAADALPARAYHEANKESSHSNPSEKTVNPAKAAATVPANTVKTTKPAESLKQVETSQPDATKAAKSVEITKPVKATKRDATETPEDSKVPAKQPSESAQPTGAAAAKPAETRKPVEEKPAEPATTKSGEQVKTATKSAEPTKPAATKPAEPSKPTATKPKEPAKPTATKPAEPAKPTATKSAETRKQEPTKSTEPANPATTKPGQPARPTVTKYTETPKPSATKSAEAAKPATTKSSEPEKPAAKPAEPAKSATKSGEHSKPEAKRAESPKSTTTKDESPQSANEHEVKVVKRETSDPISPTLAERPARILAVIPYNARSHNVMFAQLFRALALRGHTVHVLSHFPMDNPPPTYRDYSVQGAYESWEDNVDMEVVMTYTNPMMEAVLLWSETLDVCSKVLEHPSARKLLESTEEYDLVISEVFGTECMAGFAHKFKAPLVGLISSVAPPGSLDRMGNPDHPAYTTNFFLPYTEHMTFWQRLVNTFHGWAVRRLKYILCDRPTDALARRYFGPDLPSTTDLVQNTSLVLVNSHFSINQPRPMMPGVVEVGGLHIKEPKPLPEDLERFLQESEAGVVVFSLGTMVRVSTWSEERLRALWGALGALPQRVLIKSRDPLPGAPPNVRVQRWLPQFDLLNHPKVVAFVTHGGLMGTQEAVWAGVPLLGIPMFGDQHLNLNSYAEKGVAIVMHYDELSQERLSDALRRLIEDPGYRTRMSALSRQFRDRPRAALESAVWWLEYVVRHGGAAHLRSAAADLPLHQYLLLDVAALALLAVALAVGFVWFSLATVYRFLRFGSKGDRRRRLPSVSAGGQRKRYTKTKQH